MTAFLVGMYMGLNWFFRYLNIIHVFPTSVSPVRNSKIQILIIQVKANFEISRLSAWSLYNFIDSNTEICYQIQIETMFTYKYIFIIKAIVKLWKIQNNIPTIAILRFGTPEPMMLLPGSIKNIYKHEI